MDKQSFYTSNRLASRPWITTEAPSLANSMAAFCPIPALDPIYLDH